MTIQKAIKFINKILKEDDGTQQGIFISLLSDEYIKKYGLTQQQFLKSLKNSLEILSDNKKN